MDRVSGWRHGMKYAKIRHCSSISCSPCRLVRFLGRILISANLQNYITAVVVLGELAQIRKGHLNTVWVSVNRHILHWEPCRHHCLFTVLGFLCTSHNWLHFSEALGVLSSDTSSFVFIIFSTIRLLLWKFKLSRPYFLLQNTLGFPKFNCLSSEHSRRTLYVQFLLHNPQTVSGYLQNVQSFHIITFPRIRDPRFPPRCCWCWMRGCCSGWSG
jgi:hypothetical protein